MVNRKILNQNLGEVKAQRGLISDKQREVLSVRWNFILHVWASCSLAVPRVVRFPIFLMFDVVVR